jgi:hypothetical protein
MRARNKLLLVAGVMLLLAIAAVVVGMMGLTKIERVEGTLAAIEERPSWCGLATRKPVSVSDVELRILKQDDFLVDLLRSRGITALLDQEFCEENRALMGKAIRITGTRVASKEVTLGPSLANIDCFRVSGFELK